MQRLLIFIAGLSVASTATAQAARDSTDSARVRLAPVTVTATRQATSIFSAPMAVTIVGKAALEKKRGYSLDDAVGNVPGVFAQSRYGASDVRITIRGFGARGAGDRSNAGTSRGIRVLIDGIPETEPDGRTSFDLVDLAAANRVEVIRSNASALWGNAGGGVIDISTVPEFTHAFTSAQQMIGSFGFLRTSIQAATRLGPAALAATFTNTMQDGYRDNSDSRRALANVSLTSPLGESTDLGVFMTAANDLFHIPGPLTRAEAAATPRAANATYAARDEHRYNRLGRVGLSLRHAFDTVSSVSGMIYVNPKVLQRSERGTFRDFNRYHFGGNAVYRAGYDIGETITASSIVGADRAYQSGTVLFYSLTEQGTRGTQLRTTGPRAQRIPVYSSSRVSLSELASDSSLARGGTRSGMTTGISSIHSSTMQGISSGLPPRSDSISAWARLTASTRASEVASRRPRPMRLTRLQRLARTLLSD